LTAGALNSLGNEYFQTKKSIQNSELHTKEASRGAGRESYSGNGLPIWRHTTVICPEHEIAEAIGVAVAVNTGAALVYSTRVMDAYKAHKV
jgi:hypothetical protein